jgi:hypothetical protein
VRTIIVADFAPPDRARCGVLALAATRNLGPKPIETPSGPTPPIEQGLPIAQIPDATSLQFDLGQRPAGAE